MTDSSLVPFADPAWHHLPSPYYTDKHRRLQKAVRAWVDTNLMDQAHDWEENYSIDHATYKLAALDGIVIPMAGGAKIPAEWAKYGKIIGGLKAEEWDGFCHFILNDELARPGSVGVLAGLFTGLMFGAPLLYKFGSPELVEKYLPDILQGKKRICLCLTEPEAGSDLKNLSTSAVRTDDGKHFVVNGTKKWITNGIWSDYFSTAVRTRGKPGDPNGITVLLIPRTEGVTTTAMKTGGGQCSGTTQVTFNNVLVPVENIIGKENEGLKSVFFNFNNERMTIACRATRSARVCLEDAFLYAGKRVVHGKPLMDLGVIRHKLAHMARVVESQQAWIETLIYQLDQLTPEDGTRFLAGQTALVKAHCGIVFELCAREAVQIFGGLGYTRGGKGERVERLWRAVKSVTIPGGSEEVMLDLSVRQQVKLALSLGAKL